MSERNEWRPIEEAPKDGTVFDAWCHPEGYDKGFRVADVIWEPRYEAFFSDDHGILVDMLTHFMPLPDPPPPPKHSIKAETWIKQSNLTHG